MFKKVSYDQFYNEHIYLFSVISVTNFIKKFDLEIFDIKNLETHGGSIRYYIKNIKNNKIKVSNKVKDQFKKEKKFGLDKFITYKKFAKKVKLSKKKLLNILNKLKLKNKNVIGYGATAKAVTILNYCKINRDLIRNFIDTTPEKINQYMPGKNIKIIKYKTNSLDNIDYAFLGAWNFKKEITNKEKKIFKEGWKVYYSCSISKNNLVI